MKQNKGVAVILAGACLATCAAAITLTACNNQSWDVSKDGDSSLTAQLVATENGNYTLRVTGEGKMRSWESAESLPWQEHLDKITKISIQSGVETIGNNAFAGIGVEYVILPPTVAEIGEKIVDDGVKIFADNDDIAYAEGTSVYYYSETAPETHDAFWQQDKSKGDIIDFSNVPQSRRYWHENEDFQPVAWEQTKILFVGNSFTYRNGVVEHSSGVPGIFDRIAEDLGYSVETYSVTGPGWYLKNHAKATDTCGKQIDSLLNAYDDFDVVVLQEQSTNPYRNYNDFLGGVKAMQAKIEATQKHAKIYLYETWGSPYSANEDKITVPQMESKLREAYEKAAKECELQVSYVGKAFTDIYRHEKSIYLWASDNRHQGYTGAYLSACVHVGTILGGDVRKTTFKGEAQYQAPDLGDETLNALRNSAYNVVFGEVDETDEPIASGLEIAVWGRWITEIQFTKLLNGFREYCKQNGLDEKNVHYTYYTGASNTDPYYYIADFTAATVAAGGADIIFPCATNLTTQNGTSITSAEIKALGVTLNGKTDRCVAKLTNTEYANAFYEYITGEAAKTLFASL